jgi:hypothetical protein
MRHMPLSAPQAPRVRQAGRIVVSLRRLIGVLALVATQLLWVTAGTAAGQTTTSTSTTTTTTTTTTSTTSTTTPAPTTTTAAPAPPPLPSCRAVLASDPRGSVSGDATRIRVVGLPRARRLTVDLHYTGGAGGVDVRNCVALLSPSGEEVVTQDTPSLCCVAFDRRFSVPLPHQPAPGTRFCAQEAIREAFSDGLEVGFSVVFTNRVCKVMPRGSQGELPFTGSAPTVPLASLAALGIALGVALLRAARGGRQRRSP